MGRTTMNIAIVFSPNWSKYVEVELFAIYKNSTVPTKVYLLSDYIDDFQIQKFNHIADHFNNDHEVIYINVQSIYESKIKTLINVESRYTKYTLYRLLIPYLINDDNVLYIDADTIVNRDVTDLYNSLTDNYLIVGVKDTYFPIHFSDTDAYVNGGILVMNLKSIRELGIHEKWIYEVNNVYHRFHDQDIINETCRGKVLALDYKYNVSLSTGLEINAEDIVIMHYAGLKTENEWVNSLPFSEIWDKWEKQYNGTV